MMAIGERLQSPVSDQELEIIKPYLWRGVQGATWEQIYHSATALLKQAGKTNPNTLPTLFRAQRLVNYYQRRRLGLPLETEE